MDRVLFGRRVAIARAVAGMTAEELAIATQLSKSQVSRLESGKRAPTATTTALLCEALGFGPRFFTKPIIDASLNTIGHFRTNASTPMYKRDQMGARADCLSDLVELVDHTLELPKPGVPVVRARADEEIERAAERCRMQWGLGLDTPIENVNRVIEYAGVVIASIDCPEKMYGFSRASASGRSIIFLGQNTNSPSRARFSVAHECGHLVLHSGQEADEETEKQANRFAGALLLPRVAMRREFPYFGRYIAWEPLFRMKKRWGVSVAAILRRGVELGLLTHAAYRSAAQTMAHRGWAKNEPEEPAPLPVETLPAAINSIREHCGITYGDLARQLDWSTERLAQISGVTPPPSEVTEEITHVIRIPRPAAQTQLSLLPSDPVNDRHD